MERGGQGGSSYCWDSVCSDLVTTSLPGVIRGCSAAGDFILRLKSLIKSVKLRLLPGSLRNMTAVIPLNLSLRPRPAAIVILCKHYWVLCQPSPAPPCRQLSIHPSSLFVRKYGAARVKLFPPTLSPQLSAVLAKTTNSLVFVWIFFMLPVVKYLKIHKLYSLTWVCILRGIIWEVLSHSALRDTLSN